MVQFDKAIRLNPASVEGHYELGRRLFARGQIQPAFAELEEAVRLKPDHASAQLYLGLTCMALDNGEEGLNHLREAARLRPDWAEPLNAQAWALATSPSGRLRDGAQAVRLAEKAAEMTGHQQPAILHTLAAAYAEAGRFDDAVATAKQALELAQKAGQGKLVLAVQDALHAYQAHQPFRPGRPGN
jgi:tetratricopeptide (TPR) repeat protein